jgi:hypothetical protein
MGYREFTDGRWVWPEGLVHYVQEREGSREFMNDGRQAGSARKLLARRLDRDDILLRFTTSLKLAMVHLTWSGREEPDGFPTTLQFETFAQWNQWRRSNDRAP